jgi:hypothetical protein
LADFIICMCEFDFRQAQGNFAHPSLRYGEHTPEFPGHHTNTQAPPNEQAGTAVSEQPLVARVIGPPLEK